MRNPNLLCVHVEYAAELECLAPVPAILSPITDLPQNDTFESHATLEYPQLRRERLSKLDAAIL